MKLRTFVLTGCCISLVLGGCADSQHMTDYYSLERDRTQAIVDSINKQAEARQDNALHMMQAYSTSMVAAASTENTADDVAVALAWGYQMGRPDDIEIPRLPTVKAPPTNVDYIRAWTPIVGLAVPFLYPLAYGWASSEAGTRISADNGATVALDSGNAGSYNRAGYDLTTTIDNSGNQGINNSQTTCEGEECGPGGIGAPTPPIEEGCTAEELATCIATAPAGFTPAGTALIEPGCSCNSRCAGEC